MSCPVCGSIYTGVLAVAFSAYKLWRPKCYQCGALGPLYPLSTDLSAVWCEEDQDDTQLLLYSSVDAP